MVDIKELAEKAIDAAKDFNIILDYSSESIGEMEELMSKIHSVVVSQELSDQLKWNTAATFGAYLGETLLRNGLEDCGFAWGESEDGMPVIIREGNWMSPMFDKRSPGHFLSWITDQGAIKPCLN